MPKGRTNEDTTMLSMALLGYESEKLRIDEKIAELRSRLGGRTVTASTKGAKKAASATAAEPEEGKKRRTLSPAARKRIAAAQKKRWAEHRKKEAATAKE